MTVMPIEIDDAALDNVKTMMKGIRNGVPNVLVTSINKTLGTAKTQATARIGNELNLKAARIKDDMTLSKANYSNLSGALVATGEPVGLVQFGASEVQKGVTVKVKRQGSRKLLKHAFIAKGKGKSISKKDETVKTHIWWRAGRDRMPVPRHFAPGKKARANWDNIPKKFKFPIGPKGDKSIQRLTGPRIEDIFASKKVLDPVTIQAGHLFVKNVDAKITDVLRRYNG